VIKTDLSDVYRDYIACLNKQDWPKLGQFVHDEVIHNGRRVGLSGYLEIPKAARLLTCSTMSPAVSESVWTMGVRMSLVRVKYRCCLRA
jgi:hypothetical protein